MFSWTVEDEWKVGKKTLQAAVSQRMISIEKRKGSGRNEEEALLSQSLIFLVVLIQQKL